MKINCRIHTSALYVRRVAFHSSHWVCYTTLTVRFVCFDFIRNIIVINNLSFSFAHTIGAVIDNLKHRSVQHPYSSLTDESK